jgi:hypothetical protein
MAKTMQSSFTWLEVVKIERGGIAAGWLERCEHIGVTGARCVRAQSHSGPHGIPNKPTSR